MSEVIQAPLFELISCPHVDIEVKKLQSGCQMVVLCRHTGKVRVERQSRARNLSKKEKQGSKQYPSSSVE
jgi:hypothetical protein